MYSHFVATYKDTPGCFVVHSGYPSTPIFFVLDSMHKVLFIERE